jgi:hypothetical protein
MKINIRNILGLFVLALLVLQGHAFSGLSDREPVPSGRYVKLPIPDHEIPCDMAFWHASFTLVKMTYDKDENQIVFILKANADYKGDQGFECIKFYDEDDVDMIHKHNVTLNPPARDVKPGESTRARMDIPDDQILKKTKRAATFSSR